MKRRVARHAMLPSGAERDDEHQPSLLVQEWASSPAGNLGLLLRPTLPVNNATMTYHFASADHWDPTWRPRLVVTYSGGSTYHPGRLPSHASLAQLPTAPEATPPPNHTWRSYYQAAGRRVAMRVQDSTTETNQDYYLFPDHLGSTNVSYRPDNSATVVQRYFPWGMVRPSGPNALPTSYAYTGQRLDETIGLMYYGARFYDGALGRFISPDTIVPEPGNPQALNRYAYVLNNPVRYTDSTGMFSEDQIMQYLGVGTWDDVLAMFGEGGVMAGAWGFLEVLRQAELGTPISMWFDVGSGFNASQPNMMGMFSQQDGALVFSGAFLDWSGAGGSWSIGGLSAMTASTLLSSTGQYQVG